jgi:hypothetical protein
VPWPFIIDRRFHPQLPTIHGGISMNHWKALAFASMISMVFMFGFEVAHAKPAPEPRSFVEGNQPHMEAALEHLRLARGELGQAEHNKGGWRDAAIGKTDGAIADVKRGIAFADTH